MSRRDLRVAGIAAGVGLLVIVVLAGILLQRRGTETSGGGAFPVPTAALIVPDANGGVFCLQMLISGRVVAHPDWGIALSSERGGPMLTFWPHGYVGRVAGDRVELLNREGQVVARDGDHIEAAGGMTTVGGRDGIGICPTGIQVQAAQP